MERLSFEVKNGRVHLFAYGEKGADIFIPEEGIVEGKPFKGEISLSVYEFMDFLFSLYLNRDFFLRKGNLELRKGKSEDIFVKLTDYSRRERSIFYIKDLKRFLEKLEKVKAQLEVLRFRHSNLHCEYNGESLILTTESVSEEIYPERIEEIMEIARFGLYGGWDFINYGVGKVSILKPEGFLRVGDSVFKEKATFINGKKVPEATVKVYLCVR